jgi:DNA-binding CsgD family transcriptional regulator/PAS domain-containing protein
MPSKRERDSAILDTIYAAAADPACGPDVLTRASDYLRANGGLLTYLPPQPARPMMIVGRLNEELATLYLKQYAGKDPWSIAMKSVAFDKPIAANSLVEKRVIRRTGLYPDVLRPQGIEDMVSVSLKPLSARGGVGGFSFSFSERGADRMDENLQQFGRLLPHLSRALAASLQLGHYADGTRQLVRVLELMPTPALLIDAAMRIIYANPAAEALVRLNDGLSASRDGGLHLAAALPSETAALSRALAQAVSLAGGSGASLSTPLRLTRPSGRARLLVLPVPLPPPAFVLWELIESARAMLLVIDPDVLPLMSEEVAREAFDLTAAEARVAVLIGGGFGGPQAAAALGISTETVKTHLAHCFVKTGTNSQAGLARILTAFPVVYPGSDKKNPQQTT